VKLVTETNVAVGPPNQLRRQFEFLREFHHPVESDGLVLDDRAPTALAIRHQRTGTAHIVHRAEIGERGIARIGHVTQRVLVAYPDGGADCVNIHQSGPLFRE
jgi:hypothetical protein